MGHLKLSNQRNKKKKVKKKSDKSLRDLRYTTKKSNSHIIRAQKDKKEKSLGYFLEEIVAHKFSA